MEGYVREVTKYNNKTMEKKGKANKTVNKE